jgi:DNA repair protein RecN (Recombination protein N)
VTHLPAIAAAAEHHYLIEKKLSEKGFKTIVRPLTQDERTGEVARIISGDNINEISLENAAQMIRRYTNGTNR